MPKFEVTLYKYEKILVEAKDENEACDKAFKMAKETNYTRCMVEDWPYENEGED